MEVLVNAVRIVFKDGRKKRIDHPIPVLVRDLDKYKDRVRREHENALFIYVEYESKER